MVWLALAALTFALLIHRLFEGYWLINSGGRPIAHDFLSFWAGGVQAWEGQAKLIYDPHAHALAQNRLFGANIPYNPLPYPPHFLFFLLPFAPLSYVPALSAFLVTTVGAYAAALRIIVRDWFTAIAMSLSFGGAYLAFYYIQAPFIFGALLVGGLALMPKRPVAAGILFGILTVKPHLGLALAVALLLGREWRTILVAIATTSLMVIAASVAFGPEVWKAYFIADEGQLGFLIRGGAWRRGSSVYESFAPFLSPSAAMVIHLASAAFAVSLMAWLWRCHSTYGQRAAAVIATTLLISPYLYPYDAVVLTGAASFLLIGELTAPEKTFVVLACLLPGLAFFIYAAAVPLAAWLMLYVAVRHTSAVFASDSGGTEATI
jgi:hypothetical protein